MQLLLPKAADEAASRAAAASLASTHAAWPCPVLAVEPSAYAPKARMECHIHPAVADKVVEAVALAQLMPGKAGAAA